MIPNLPPVLATHNVFTTIMLMPPVEFHYGMGWEPSETICILPDLLDAVEPLQLQALVLAWADIKQPSPAEFFF